MRRSEIPMSELVIRDAVADDALILHKMETDCFSDPWSLGQFDSFLKNPSIRILIAEEDGFAVGFAALAVIVDECEILNIAVMPDHRGCGIGRMLMKRIIDICQSSGVSSLFLEHRKSNTVAASLYNSFGFTEYAVRRRYYSSPTEDAILKKLTL